MASAAVIRVAERELTEFYLDEGCYIVEMADSTLDPGLSIARCRVAPASSTAWHKLAATTERYLIASGCGIVSIGSVEQRVVAGDVVIIPEDCPQRIQNTGEDEWLVFHAICTPRFTPECYCECSAP